MSNFTPLYGSILTSTIWAEDAETRLVWITMLAMADASGYVGASIPGLAHAARVSTDGCRSAITKFLSPDPDSRTKENDGRRIVEADGGWTLLNYSRHRERATEIRHNALSAIRMRELRAKRKVDERVANVPEHPEQLQNVTDVPQARHRQGIGKAKCEYSDLSTDPKSGATKHPDAEFKSLKGAEFPEALRTERFLSAWRTWERYHKERGTKHRTKTGDEKQLTKCAKMGVRESIEAMDHSMANGWQGMFPPDKSKTEKEPEGTYIPGIGVQPAQPPPMSPEVRADLEVIYAENRRKRDEALAKQGGENGSGHELPT